MCVFGEGGGSVLEYLEMRGGGVLFLKWGILTSLRTMDLNVIQ